MRYQFGCLEKHAKSKYYLLWIECEKYGIAFIRLSHSGRVAAAARTDAKQSEQHINNVKKLVLIWITAFPLFYKRQKCASAELSKYFILHDRYIDGALVAFLPDFDKRFEYIIIILLHRFAFPIAA